MKRYWDHVEIGDRLPMIARAPISRLQIAQFAAASDDFSPLNLDDDFAKNAGLGGAYAPGLMSLGFVEDALRSFATNMKIFSLVGTFQRFIWPGDRLVTHGLLVRRYQKNKEHRVEFSLWCQNQNQDVVMRGESTCILFKNHDDEKRLKTSFPPISKATHNVLEERLARISHAATARIEAKNAEHKELV